jgi:hypothetical protein
MKRKSRHPLHNDRNLAEDRLLFVLDAQKKEMEAAKKRINPESKTLSSELFKACADLKLSGAAPATAATGSQTIRARKRSQGRKETHARERRYEQNQTLDEIIQHGKGPASVWAPNGGNP